MLILYITYVDMESGVSGSAVRPKKMYRAFLEEGHEVKLLSGSQERWDREKRAAAVCEIRRWLKENKPDVCYIESPSTPITFGFDAALIRDIHRMGIPVGYFYRDFYWRFPELYPRRTDFVGRLKDLWMDVLQKRTDDVLRCADIVYFPSEGCKQYFSYKDMRLLPPAGEEQDPERRPEERTCIYVGGIGGDYGGAMMLKAFRRLNAGEKRYPLLLVCREKEWNAFRSAWENEPWLEVHHTSGDGLPPLYARAEAALMPIEKNPYTDLSVNVKIFEYMSFGLPIVSTNVEAVARIVEDNRIGVSARDDSEEAFAAAVGKLFADRSALLEYGRNGLEALKEKHLWVHRARQAVSELGEWTT